MSLAIWPFPTPDSPYSNTVESNWLTRNAFYVALHRCRGYLRDLLAHQEGSLDHV